MATMRKKPRKSRSAANEIITGLKQLRYAFETGDFSKVTIRTAEIRGPSAYGAKEVKALRGSMGVSQGVFAQLVAVSPDLVAHWEHGIRKPAPVVCRLFDKIKEDPAGFIASHMRRKIA
ncbi:MAG TPA: hypothetical protein VIM11_16320 [Tepidisphaeraceae bacterium]|jgi:DNA-binding transcriptional regulator YiaG